jgi:hypothetical protein
MFSRGIKMIKLVAIVGTMILTVIVQYHMFVESGAAKIDSYARSSSESIDYKTIVVSGIKPVKDENSNETKDKYSNASDISRRNLSDSKEPSSTSAAGEILSSPDNPPFQPCDNKTDLTTYSIHAYANFNRILRQDKSQSIPISVNINVTTLASDGISNLVKVKTPIMKGSIVAFPGDIRNQISVPISITKVLISCKQIQSPQKSIDR